MAEVIGRAVYEVGTDDSKLDKELKGVRKKSERSMKDIGKRMTVAVTAPILGIGAAVFAATEEIDAAMATIQTGTGATGEALQGLRTDFEGVYGTIPASAQEVASTMADANTRLGLTGQALQDVTRTALEGGIEINTLAQAMQLFNVPAEEAPALMDKFFKASQTAGIGVNELIGQVQTFGPVLQNAGFSLDETTALFANFNAEGVDLTRVMPGLNAFVRKAAEDVFPDYSDAIKDARKNINDLTDGLEKNLEAQGKLNDTLTDTAEGALDKHFSAIERNDGAIQKAEQELAIFNARMAEQGDEIKESTRLANGFKQVALEENLQALRQEQAALTVSGGLLRAAIQETTDIQFVHGKATKGNTNLYEETITKLRETKSELNGVESDYSSLTAEQEVAAAALARYSDLQSQGADTTLDIKAALLEQVTAIQAAETHAIKLNIATEAFGAEGAQRMVTAIDNGVFSLDNLIDVMDESEGAILDNAEATRTNTERMAIMRAEIKDRLAGAWASLPAPLQLVTGGLGSVLAATGPLLMAMPALIGFVKTLTITNAKNAIQSGITAVATIARTVATVAGTVATAAATLATTAFGVALTIATGPIGLIVIAIAALVAAAILIWKNWDTIKEKTLEIWEKIKTFLSKTWDTIVGFFRDNWKLILGILFPAVGIALLIANNWGKIKNKVKDIWDRVVRLFKDNWKKVLGVIFPVVGIAMLVKNNWGKIVGTVKEVWDKVVAVIQAAIDKIKGIITDSVKSITDIWSGATDALSNVPIVGGLFGGGGGGGIGGVGSEVFPSGFSSLNPFAAGGIVTRPTAALIGEDKPEAVIPLDRLAAMMGSGGGNIVFNGDTYGFDDFEDKVDEAFNRRGRRGF